MKTKADYQKELDELGFKLDDMQQKITELQITLAKQSDEVKKEWPQVGDKYWSINGNGSIIEFICINTPTDNMRKAFHNIFRTEAEAAKARNYRQFEGDVREKAAELNDGWVADWKTATQQKFCIEFDSHIKIGQHQTALFLIVRGSECNSREAAQALLDRFGADKFLAYATGGDL